MADARRLAQDCFDLLQDATSVDPAAAEAFSTQLADMISDTLASAEFDGPSLDELGHELGEFAASLDLQQVRLASYAEPQIRALARNTQLATLGGATLDLADGARTLDGVRKIAKVMGLDHEIVNQNLPALIVAITIALHPFAPGSNGWLGPARTPAPAPAITAPAAKAAHHPEPTVEKAPHRDSWEHADADLKAPGEPPPAPLKLGHLSEVLHGALVAAAQEGTAEALPLTVERTARDVVSRYPLEFRDTPEGSARQLEQAARLYTDLKFNVEVEPGRLLAANREQLESISALAYDMPEVGSQVAAGIVSTSEMISPRYLERMYEQDRELACDLNGDAAKLLAAVNEEFDRRLSSLQSQAGPDVSPARLRQIALDELAARAEHLGSLIEAEELRQATRPQLSADPPQLPHAGTGTASERPAL